MLARVLRGPAPVIALVGVATAVGALHGGFTDLFVYQHAGLIALDGLPAEARDPVTGLRFTYPPFAAVLMAPLAPLPSWVAAGLWTAASVAALAAVVALVRRSLDQPAPGWLVALLTLGAVALEPVWQNLVFGQINTLIMLAVLVDLLRPSQRWSGVLIGIAAGVKLTPLVFVVLLVLVGRRTAAGRAIVAFAGTVAIGVAVNPGWSASYWGHGLVDAGRIGPPALAHNQSVYGALTRLLDARPSILLWLAVAVPLAVAVLGVGVRWWRRGDPLLGTCLAATSMLLASPVSWSHHWVWCAPIALVLWERGRMAAVAWTMVFVARPILWPSYGEGREYAWTGLDHIVGNAYLLAAIALAAWAAGRLRQRAETGVSGSGPEKTLPRDFPDGHPEWLTPKVPATPSRRLRR
ncbi:MAG TPA: glycosyltransferase 87 family protein [Intrasporangium sp.]|nr:glycosyltransferase 87 family protein [Intrasporangium sp.]